AKEAFKKGIMTASPVLLEPIMNVKISVSEHALGDVMSDLNSRRGQVTGMDTLEDGTTVIDAEVPAGAIQRYAIDLRSITQGRGTFHATFIRYQPVPSHLADEIIAQASAGGAGR